MGHHHSRLTRTGRHRPRRQRRHHPRHRAPGQTTPPELNACPQSQASSGDTGRVLRTSAIADVRARSLTRLTRTDMQRIERVAHTDAYALTGMFTRQSLKPAVVLRISGLALSCLPSLPSLSNAVHSGMVPKIAG